jgi:excisionase family DNA binding protein
MENQSTIPMLVPIEAKEFWSTIREIIRDELKNAKTDLPTNQNITETNGLTEKPLYKIQEVCTIFKITKPTIYDWIKHGKLKKIKIRSRVYFLGSDVRELMQA